MALTDTRPPPVFDRTHRSAQTEILDDPISTAGAAVLWSGLGIDPGLLHQQTLVLRPLNYLGAGVEAHVSEGATL